MFSCGVRSRGGVGRRGFMMLDSAICRRDHSPVSIGREAERFTTYESLPVVSSSPFPMLDKTLGVSVPTFGASTVALACDALVTASR